jgi:hypothetical protein
MKTPNYRHLVGRLMGIAGFILPPGAPPIHNIMDELGMILPMHLANAVVNVHIKVIEIWPDDRVVMPSLDARRTHRQSPNIDEPG